MIAVAKRCVSCHPTRERKLLAAVVLTIVCSTALVLVGVIHAGSDRGVRPSGRPFEQASWSAANAE